ncbi:hypothetical protein [Acrocarpospora sp. B8E8]|uniref:DUF6907 domain-containing protein n=1 Tax=Acrocarpospora sp. B8E8 TaxID=3153572 RepID=UPI00325CA874
MNNSTGANDDANLSETIEPPANAWWIAASPCPTWCQYGAFGGHTVQDHPGDRIHTMPSLKVPLAAAMDWQDWGSDAMPRWEPVELMADLWQTFREAEPRLLLADTLNKFYGELTLGEAQQFAGNLAAHVVTARRSVPAVPEADAPRPDWLTGPCPDWCAVEHTPSDHPDDREHRNDASSVPLTVMSFEELATPGGHTFLVPPRLFAHLAQHYREADARVIVHDGEGETEWQLSLGEAGQLAANLAGLVRLGTPAAPGADGPEISHSEEGESWVTRIGRPEYGELVLTREDGRPTIVGLWNVRDADLSPEQAQGFALDILHLLATRNAA